MNENSISLFHLAILRRAWPAILLVLTAFVPLRAAEYTAVIDDPDGFTNLRQAPGPSARVIAKVQAGEKFVARGSAEEDWWHVKLDSGVEGYMHKSRIKMLEKRAPGKLSYSRKQAVITDRKSEAATHAAGLGVDYAAISKNAADGDHAALAKFFALERDMDGAAAESHYAAMWAMFHVVGDDKFADFLSLQTAAVRKHIRDILTEPFVTYPIDEPIPYLRRYFPKSAAALLGE
jgi:hypothetical protein